jgi:hypothetical protein
MKLLVLVLICILGSTSAAQTTAAASTAPAKQPAVYELSEATVYGMPARQWILIVSPPTGGHSVVTPDKLLDLLSIVVPPGSTLRWAPSDVVIGGEPLRSEAALEALKAWCAAHDITLVRVPGG